MTTTTYDTQAEINFLNAWAAQNKCIFDEDGEVGFGRECVGITRHDHYVDLYVMNDDYSINEAESVPWELAAPPSEVDDAYHKHDCLAVLGRGPRAIHQLAVWVKKLEENGLTVKSIRRPARNEIELLIHGTHTPVLTRAEG